MESRDNTYQLIKDAYNLLNKRKSPEAIVILEKVLSSGYGDIYILLLLAIAYLYNEEYEKASRVIIKIRDLKPDYMPIIQLGAFLKLKSALTFEEALKIYLDLTEKYPADPHLQRARKTLSYSDNFSQFQKQARLGEFVYIPKPPKELKRTTQGMYVGTLDQKGIRIKRSVRLPSAHVVKWLMVIFLAVIISIAGVFIYRSGVVKELFKAGFNASKNLESVDRINIDGTGYDLEKGSTPKTPVHYTSVHDMADDFERARELIKKGKNNEAVLLLNRIYSSNANFMVKEKVDFLIKFIISLEDRRFVSIPFEKVQQQKYLYRGYSVKWEGQVADLRQKEGGTTFTLQIGPGKDQEYEGLAQVFSRASIGSITNGALVEVQGVIVDIIGDDKKIYIESRGIATLREQVE